MKSFRFIAVFFLLFLVSFGALAQDQYDKDADIQAMVELGLHKPYKIRPKLEWRAIKFAAVCASDAAIDFSYLLSSAQLELLPLGGLFVTAGDRIAEKHFDGDSYQRKIEYIDSLGVYDAGNTRTVTSFFGGGLNTLATGFFGGSIDILEWLSGDDDPSLTKEMAHEWIKPSFAGTKINFEDLTKKSDRCKLAYEQLLAAREASEILKGQSTEVAIDATEEIKSVEDSNSFSNVFSKAVVD